MKKIFTCFFLCFFAFAEILLIENSYAISKEEYEKSKKLSPEFAQAENDINLLWKQLNSAIKNKDKKQQLLQNQREWIKDRDGKYGYEDGSVSIVNFAYATNDRIAELFLYKKYVENDYLPIKISGKIIQQAEERYADDTGYFLYSKIKFNKNEYPIYILLCPAEEKANHKDVDAILGRAEDDKDVCSILIDYDILRNIQPLSFINPTKNEKCSLQW